MIMRTATGEPDTWIDPMTGQRYGHGVCEGCGHRGNFRVMPGAAENGAHDLLCGPCIDGDGR